MKTMISKEGFQVILLGIIFNTKTRKILIGKRENDPYVPKLSWVFPGGKAEFGEELEKTLKKKIKEKTGLRVENLGNIFTRIFSEKKDFLLVYYLCEVVEGKEKPKDEIVELKWVNPEELENYFTTSFHPYLKEYIMNLK
ncbi:MAG: NUDIX domain-containing protein [Candidatus Pacearchaeota archaeon]|nr:NUDIX domain-containing protein [Candidatus Pacearchaeota archaeon]